MTPLVPEVAAPVDDDAAEPLELDVPLVTALPTLPVDERVDEDERVEPLLAVAVPPVEVAVELEEESRPMLLVPVKPVVAAVELGVAEVVPDEELETSWTGLIHARSASEVKATPKTRAIAVMLTVDKPGKRVRASEVRSNGKFATSSSASRPQSTLPNGLKIWPRAHLWHFGSVRPLLSYAGSS